MRRTLVEEEIQNLSFEVKEGESLQLNLAAFSSFPNVTLEVHVGKDATFEGSFADFSDGSGTFNANIYLEGEGAKGEWRTASIANKKSRKIINANLYHKVPHTEGLTDNYGITKDEARLSFVGTSAIDRGSFGSATRQSAKIIVFDPRSQGKCAPILIIDENDVKASHAAIVGKLNDEHIFYLCSRGLSEEEAKRLITLGYLKPIVPYFEEELGQKILNAIEEGI